MRDPSATLPLYTGGAFSLLKMILDFASFLIWGKASIRVKLFLMVLAFDLKETETGQAPDLCIPENDFIVS